MRINENFSLLQRNYLFSEVTRRTLAYEREHPGKKLIRLSVGDVTLPLAPVAVEAMQRAAGELSAAETFRGYANDVHGYPALTENIIAHYARMGVSLEEGEIFVSDGAKSDLGNLSDLFSSDNTVLIPDPVYPAYVDTNLLAGRRVVYARADGENGFLPMPDEGTAADIIYLCSPNNPTGAVYTREQLGAWVEYASRTGAVILFDAAYERFISDDVHPRTVYAVEGAKECAIEICSFSKTAGFTGVRCGYTVVPHALVRGVPLNGLWERRQSAKFNGVSFVTQMGAAAVYTEKGEEQLAKNIAYYRRNAKIIASCLTELEIPFVGGEHSPYLWMKCPCGMESWEFFGYLLGRAGVAGTPGSGFGRGGEGYFRLTAFNSEQNTREACRRMSALLREKKTDL